MRVRRDVVDLLFGVGVLALGLVVLGFTFSQAFALAQAPGDFFGNQLPQESAAAGPVASFRWDSNDRTLTVEDTSRRGDASIVSWEWNFGDGTRASGQSPGSHQYSSASVYQVALIVRDENGKESRAFAEATLVPGETRSGESFSDPTASLQFDLNFGEILLPIGVAVLTFGLYLVMAVVGGIITKAGWNLIKPKPETIRVRLKPKDLMRSLEEDAKEPPPPPTA